MPNLKNTFLKGKMNKDLDPRLLPEGEYIDAININVSKSENGDVGAVENILGNTNITNLSGSDYTDVEVIGFVVDEENAIVYYFATNHSGSARASSSDKCYIIKHQIKNNTTETLLESHRLNFNKDFPIYGANVIDGLIFFTDNNNQPRVYNTLIAKTKYVDNDLLEDKLSVAKYAPYLAPRMLKPKYVVTVDTAGASSSTTIPITAANTDIATDLSAGAVFLLRHDSLANDIIVSSINNTSGSESITVSDSVTISAGEKITLITGSMIDSGDVTIDDEYIKEKFVRFSYRYKFIDNSYSVFSPFSQIAFEPLIGTMDNNAQKDAWETTKVDDFINKIDQLELEIILPTDNPKDDLFIEEIEILIKESDDPSVKVVDTIKLNNISNLYKDVTTITNGAVGANKLKKYINNIDVSGNNRTKDLYYVYRSEQPYKTLPENQLTRVYDRVPTKALAQEISGNRVIYGNFVSGAEVPSLNYSLSTGEKNSEDEFVYEEYKRHTLKQNRSYTVGVVLSDKFGRQSPVLLSSNSSSSILNRKSAKGDVWNGDALKITFNDQIPSNYLYSSSNPLGWYSYRIVVKQTQQEYYNIYTSGITIYPDSGDNFGYFPVYGDNINKIPRDEINQSLDTALTTSGVKLYGVIENNDTGLQSSTHSVISIGKLDDLGIPTADQDEFYGNEKSYLYAQLKSGYGQITGADSTTAEDLAVFETAPFESKLDIFYETSSSGLISELNAAIVSGVTSGSIPNTSTFDTNTFAESTSNDTFIITITVLDQNASALTNAADNLTVSLDSIIRNSVDVSNDFSITLDNGSYKIKLLNGQQYLSSGNVYSIQYTATTDNGTLAFNKTFSITNSNPTIAFVSPNTSVGYNVSQTGVLTTINSSGVISATNGSTNTTINKQNISFSRVSGDNRINVSPAGAISLSTGIASHETNIQVVVRVTDSGNATADLTTPLSLNASTVVDVVESSTTTGGNGYYFRCYGAQGSQDPGDLHNEYFLPTENKYREETGNCITNEQEIVSNHTGRDVDSFPAGEKFSQVFVDGTKALDTADYTWVNGNDDNAFWVRVAPHANSDPALSGYVGNANSNFIVSISSVDYELIIGYEEYGSVTEPVHRVLVQRNNITTTQA